MSERKSPINGKSTFKGADKLAMKIGGFDAKCRLEVGNLHLTLKTLSGLLGRDLRQLVMDASAEAAKTAAMYTPPQVGRRNPKKLLRGMLTLRQYYDKESKSLKMLPKKAWRYKVMVERNSRKGARAPFGANGSIRNFTNIGNNLVFKEKRQAEKYRFIPARGLARAGWWGAVDKIKSLPAGSSIKTNLDNIKPVTDLVRRLSKEISTVDVSDDGMTVTVTNHYRNIENFAAVSQFMGYKSVANRWNAWKNEELKKIPRLL